MTIRKIFTALFLFVAIIYSLGFAKTNLKKDPPGNIIGNFNGIKLYADPNVDWENGEVSNDLNYQCVEYVDRYYYNFYGVNLPSVSNDKACNALDDWDNIARLKANKNNLSKQKPKPGDIIVFGATPDNIYGHIAIVSQVTANKIIFAQQNWPGEAFGQVTYKVKNKLICVNKYYNYEVIGWLIYEKLVPPQINENEFTPSIPDVLVSTGPSQNQYKVHKIVQVDARYLWTNTQVKVQAGDELIIKAWGKAMWAPHNGYMGPEGILFGNINNKKYYWDWDKSKNMYRDGTPVVAGYFDSIPAPHGALIGKIDTNNVVVYIGEHNQFRVQRSGTLILGINDDPNGLYDNDGYWTVEIIVK